MGENGKPPLQPPAVPDPADAGVLPLFVICAGFNIAAGGAVL